MPLLRRMPLFSSCLMPFLDILLLLLLFYIPPLGCAPPTAGKSRFYVDEDGQEGRQVGNAKFFVDMRKSTKDKIVALSEAPTVSLVKWRKNPAGPSTGAGGGGRQRMTERFARLDLDEVMHEKAPLRVRSKSLSAVALSPYHKRKDELAMWMRGIRPGVSFDSRILLSFSADLAKLIKMVVKQTNPDYKRESQLGPDESNVFVNSYDYLPHLNKAGLNAIGAPAIHGSIVFRGPQWRPPGQHGGTGARGRIDAQGNVGNGVKEIDPFDKSDHSFNLIQQKYMGRTKMTQREIRAFAHAELGVNQKFNQYDPRTRNCNHFVEEMAMKTLQEQPPSQRRPPSINNRLMRAFGGGQKKGKN